ncbi:hypothetical protein OC498_02170 [Acinetobacter bohemicus]|uniref:Uncharacterized protein n=2 Tax=Gammaproteobacteria TaxID=1236 RepID=A0A9D2USQ2_ACILW|nr:MULTISPECIES: hypothetical protein [Acinetobacter]MDM1780484.1 hypothetical protein [Acinetobacter indicus]HJF28029.1 hypothetical protein [Acinetobacter lwoffii]MCO8041704.1 hypothetical protein [Acinetobacter sp. S4400-12]MCO8045671.1 hypothetical protein [Acinetobacter sp. S4397-1]MCU7223721.1 hypothetical protein [Acinetobacter bohemicus]
MLSVHFNKQVFIDALKTNTDLVTFLSTSIALMLTLFVHCLIQGNLKLEYFGYAMIVSMVFFLWALVDQKYR